MTTTETQVREALSAAAGTREIDVERLWQQFRTEQTAPSPRKEGRLIPLAAAAATLLIVGLVVVVRGHSTATRSAANPATSHALEQLPPWPNGTPATTYPLPGAASTPLVFDTATDRTVVYYTAAPSRLCVIDISLSAGRPTQTNSITCGGEGAYAITPVAQGRGWMLGTTPPGTGRVDVTVDGTPATVQIVNNAHMPRAVFFARYPGTANPFAAHTITWTFIGAHGRVIDHSGIAPRVVTPLIPYHPSSPPTYRATPVSAIATFTESSGRVLHIYWAGDEHGFCSNEQVPRTGRSPATVSEDCGASFSPNGVFGRGQWLPADAGGGGGAATTIDLWGVMPPGATKTVIVSAAGHTTIQSAQADGMPTGVYAGSVDGSPGAMVIYFLDSDGHVVVAEPWQFPPAPVPTTAMYCGGVPVHPKKPSACPTVITHR